MEKRSGDEGEIARISSIPPPDDDAYGAPTKVGEAAYRMLAEGMAAFDVPPTSQPQPPMASPRSGSPPRPVSGRSDDGSLPRGHADSDIDVEELVGRTVMPQVQQAPLPPLVPSCHELPVHAMSAPSSAPMVPSPARDVMISPPMSLADDPPSPISLAERFRPEIIIGIASFLTVAVPAIIYLLLR